METELPLLLSCIGEVFDNVQAIARDLDVQEVAVRAAKGASATSQHAISRASPDPNPNPNSNPAHIPTSTPAPTPTPTPNQSARLTSSAWPPNPSPNPNPAPGPERSSLC